VISKIWFPVILIIITNMGKNDYYESLGGKLQLNDKELVLGRKKLNIEEIQFVQFKRRTSFSSGYIEINNNYKYIFGKREQQSFAELFDNLSTVLSKKHPIVEISNIGKLVDRHMLIIEVGNEKNEDRFPHLNKYIKVQSQKGLVRSYIFGVIFFFIGLLSTIDMAFAWYEFILYPVVMFYFGWSMYLGNRRFWYWAENSTLGHILAFGLSFLSVPIGFALGAYYGGFGGGLYTFIKYNRIKKQGIESSFFIRFKVKEMELEIQSINKLDEQLDNFGDDGLQEGKQA